MFFYMFSLTNMSDGTKGVGVLSSFGNQQRFQLPGSSIVCQNILNEFPLQRVQLQKPQMISCYLQGKL